MFQIILMLSMLGTISADNVLKYKSAHDKTYNKTCVTSEDSNQTAHPRSLIRVFADRMCFLQPLGYPWRNKREHLPYWVDMQADLSLCWSHRAYCRCCRVLAHMFYYCNSFIVSCHCSASLCPFLGNFYHITKTCLFKYTEHFNHQKMKNFR